MLFLDFPFLGICFPQKKNRIMDFLLSWEREEKRKKKRKKEMEIREATPTPYSSFLFPISDLWSYLSGTGKKNFCSLQSLRRKKKSVRLISRLSLAFSSLKPKP